jgi:hypothetical protein
MFTSVLYIGELWVRPTSVLDVGELWVRPTSVLNVGDFWVRPTSALDSGELWVRLTSVLDSGELWVRSSSVLNARFLTTGKTHLVISIPHYLTVTFFNLSSAVVALYIAWFNIRQFCILSVKRICVLCGYENKQRLFPYTTMCDWLYD